MSSPGNTTFETNASPARQRLPGPLKSLSVALGLLAVGALQGGIAMVADPISPLGMSTEYLDGLPVETYLLPGWFLICISAAALLTLLGILIDWKWRWAAGIEDALGYRWPWLGSVLTGSILLAFEIIELFAVPFHPVMHPLLIAVSLILILLPLTPSARSRLSTRSQF